VALVSAQVGFVLGFFTVFLITGCFENFWRWPGAKWIGGRPFYVTIDPTSYQISKHHSVCVRVLVAGKASRGSTDN